MCLYYCLYHFKESFDCCSWGTRLYVFRYQNLGFSCFWPVPDRDPGLRQWNSRYLKDLQEFWCVNLCHLIMACRGFIGIALIKKINKILMIFSIFYFGSHRSSVFTIRINPYNKLLLSIGKFTWQSKSTLLNRSSSASGIYVFCEHFFIRTICINPLTSHY